MEEKIRKLLEKGTIAIGSRGEYMFTAVLYENGHVAARVRSQKGYIHLLHSLFCDYFEAKEEELQLQEVYQYSLTAFGATGFDRLLNGGFTEILLDRNEIRISHISYTIPSINDIPGQYKKEVTSKRWIDAVELISKVPFYKA